MVPVKVKEWLMLKFGERVMSRLTERPWPLVELRKNLKLPPRSSEHRGKIRC